MSVENLELGNGLAGTHCVVCDLHDGSPRHASGYVPSLRNQGAGITSIDLGRNSSPNGLLRAIKVTAQTHERYVLIFGGCWVQYTFPDNVNAALLLASKHGMPAFMIQPPKYLELIRGDFIPVRDRPRNLAPQILAALKR